MILPLALPVLLLAFFLLLVLLIVMIEVRVLSYAYRKIGVRPRYMVAVLLLTLVGSQFNIPLYSVSGTVVAINVGGALVPLLLSLYLFFRFKMYVRMLLGIAVVAIIVHGLAQIVPGVGIAVPMLIPGEVDGSRAAPPDAAVQPVTGDSA